MVREKKELKKEGCIAHSREVSNNLYNIAIKESQENSIQENPKAHPVLFVEGRNTIDRAHLYYTMVHRIFSCGLIYNSYFQFVHFEIPTIAVVSASLLALYAFGR